MEPFQQTIPAWRPPTKKVPDLGPEQAHVWRVPLQEALNSKTVRRCRRLLSREEIERSESFQSPTRGNQFIIYRGALRILLSRYTRYWARRIRYDYGPNGKPVLHHPRFFPSGLDLDFSVSHSGDYALIGFTRDLAFGVDIEQIRVISDAVDQIKRVFSVREQTEYMNLDPNHRALGFFNCWTRKKAFVRALGESFTDTMPKVEVALTPGAPPRLHLHAISPGDEARWMFFSFEPATGYTASIAVESTRTDLSFRDFSFDV